MNAKLKIIMNEEKIKKESNISVEETYTKINELMQKIGDYYIEDNCFCFKRTKEGLINMSKYFFAIDELAIQPWFLSFAEQITLIEPIGPTDLLDYLKEDYQDILVS